MSDTVRVFFDTSALRKETGRNTRTLQRLEELVNEDILQVLVYELVVREFVTGLAEKALRPISQGTRDITKAVTWFGSARDRKKAENAFKQITKTAEEWEKLIKGGFDHWLRQLGANRIPIRASHTKAAWDLYFTGKPPFKGKKNRPDIPDGFIFAAITELASQAGSELHVVCADGSLKKACEGQPNIEVHDKISEFLVSKSVKTAIKNNYANLMSAQAWADLARSSITQRHESIKEGIRDGLDDVLSGYSVNEHWLPSDNQEATLMGAGNLDEIEINMNSVEQLDGSTALMEVAVEISDAPIDVYIHRSEYWGFRDDMTARYSATDMNWNEHVVQAESLVSGTVDLVVACMFEHSDDEEFNVIGVEIQHVESVSLHDPDEM